MKNEKNEKVNYYNKNISILTISLKHVYNNIKTISDDFKNEWNDLSLCSLLGTKVKCAQKYIK